MLIEKQQKRSLGMSAKGLLPQCWSEGAAGRKLHFGKLLPTLPLALPLSAQPSPTEPGTKLVHKLLSVDSKSIILMPIIFLVLINFGHLGQNHGLSSEKIFKRYTTGCGNLCLICTYHSFLCGSYSVPLSTGITNDYFHSIFSLFLCIFVSLPWLS